MTGEPPLTPPYWRWLMPLLIAGALLLGVLAVKRAVNQNADLNGNYRWWRANLEQPTLPVRREGPDSQDPDSYPPITYALFAPLGALPLWATATLWYGLNLGCSIYLFSAARDWLESELGVTQLPFSTPLIWPMPPRPEQFLSLAVMAVLPAWISSLLLGQNTLPLICLTWGAFQAIRHNRPSLGGGLLALATVMKVLPVVFLLPFLIRPNVRVLLAYGITGLLLVAGLGSLYFGPRTNWDFHQRWLQLAAHGPENRPADPLDPNTMRGSLRYHNQSVEVVLARLLMPVPIHDRPRAPHVNLSNLSAETWRRTRTVASGLCVLVGLVALFGGRRVGARTDEKPSDGLATTSVETYGILSLLQLFISPIVWSHYYLWLFWPLLWVLVAAYRGRRSGYAIYLIWLAALPLLAMPVLRAVGIHLWVTLILFVWICWPRLMRIRSNQRRVGRVVVPG